MNSIKNYIEEHQERMIQELMDWLRIPSVSADPAYVQDVRKAATYLQEKLVSVGMDNIEICETPGHPIVYADKIIDASLPTVLVYGHYDVQPPDPLALWNSGPFDPIIKDDKIYARGACDDKGQVYMHVKALEYMLHTDQLPCNVKLIVEGEEEVGSNHLETFIRDRKDRLKCDVILVSDTAMIANDVPSITTGLRGLSYVEVEVTGPNIDLHSGTFGGAVANPVNILCSMIASMHDENRHITIPGFYDNVAVVSDEERAIMNSAPFSIEEYKDYLEVNEVLGENGYTTLERTSIRPTLDVNGIWGGYIGEGAKTVLPSKANAKISMRLVPNQSSEEITALFQKHFDSIAPPSVTVKVTPHHGGEPSVTEIDSDGYRAASKAMVHTFGKIPIPVRTGGSIPIVAMFEEVLGVKTVLMGFGLDSDAIHSPNEKFGVFNFLKGIETIPWFFYEYAKA